MRSYSHLKSDLAKQLREDLPQYFVDNHAIDADKMAGWILMRYKPPTEWEVADGDMFRAIHSFRVMIAGQFFKYSAAISEEQVRRSSEVVTEIKRRIRWSVGKTIADFLAGEKMSDV